MECWIVAGIQHPITTSKVNNSIIADCPFTLQTLWSCSHYTLTQGNWSKWANVHAFFCSPPIWSFFVRITCAHNHWLRTPMSSVKDLIKKQEERVARRVAKQASITTNREKELLKAATHVIIKFTNTIAENLSVLPLDLWSYMFGFLDVDDVHQCMQVCKAWYVLLDLYTFLLPHVTLLLLYMGIALTHSHAQVPSCCFWARVECLVVERPRYVFLPPLPHSPFLSHPSLQVL